MNADLILTGTPMRCVHISNQDCTKAEATAEAEVIRASRQFSNYCCREYSVWENSQTGKMSVVVGKFGTAGYGWRLVKGDLCCEEAETLSGITGACGKGDDADIDDDRQGLDLSGVWESSIPGESKEGNTTVDTKLTLQAADKNTWTGEYLQAVHLYKGGTLGDPRPMKVTIVVTGPGKLSLMSKGAWGNRNYNIDGTFDNSQITLPFSFEEPSYGNYKKIVLGRK